MRSSSAGLLLALAIFRPLLSVFLCEPVAVVHDSGRAVDHPHPTPAFLTARVVHVVDGMRVLLPRTAISTAVFVRWHQPITNARNTTNPNAYARSITSRRILSCSARCRWISVCSRSGIRRYTIGVERLSILIASTPEPTAAPSLQCPLLRLRSLATSSRVLPPAFWAATHSERTFAR